MWLILVYLLKEQQISYPTNIIFLESYSELFIAGALSNMIMSRELQEDRVINKTSKKWK